VIFFDISEAVILVGARLEVFLALFLAFGRFRQGLSAQFTASTIKIFSTFDLNSLTL
jgi:hypothetical protein